MLKFSEIENITTAQEVGAWVDDLPHLPGVAVKVRGNYNSDWARRYAELTAGLSEEEKKDDDIMDAVDAQLQLDTILLDWKGLEEDYSVERATELLTDKRYRIFRRGVAYASNVVGAKGKKTLEDDTKNSSTLSGGE